MASSSLDRRTIRPGSLGNYSYYRSSRHLEPQAKSIPFIAAPGGRLVPWKLLVAVVLVLAVAVMPFLNGGSKPKPAASKSQTSKSSTPPPAAAVAAAPVAKADKCVDNAFSKLVMVSIGQRHMWACSGPKTVYDSPVITGMSAYAATVTPTGSYKIYSKQTNLTLTGSDITGSWSDPVHYWMPFLNNQYGTYGFHDATWRPSDSFGKVSPDSSKASHGCVELPLSTAAWLYRWAGVGTRVSIRD